MQQRQSQGQTRRRIEIEPGPEAQLLPAVGVVAIQRGIAPKAVGPVPVHGQAPGGLFAQRPADGQSESPHIVVAEGKLGFGFRVPARLARARIDQSSQRIGAVARALRPAQDLHAAQVETRGDAADGGEVDVVQQETHRGVRRAFVLRAFADSAHLEITRPGRSAGPVQVGRKLHQLLEVLHRRAPDCLRVQHRNAGRQVQAAHLLQRGRDHHFLQHAARRFLRRGLLRLRRGNGSGSAGEQHAKRVCGESANEVAVAEKLHTSFLRRY